MTTRQKIIALYPYVYTRCISKMIGCNKPYPYEVIRRLGLPILRPKRCIDKIPPYKRWKD